LYSPVVVESAEALERRIDELRAAVRHAVVAGDRSRASALRADLRQAERAWDAAVADLADRAGPPVGAPADPPPVPRQGGPLLPVREQVHHALTLLSVPAAPKLVSAVHAAFFAGEIGGVRLTSLRRDEERSFRSAPYSRPYYLCPALSADLLAPARGLLTVSTWPLDRRVVGPLSARVDFLVSAIRIAEQVARMPDAGSGGSRLLWRFAVNITGVAGARDPAGVAAAARTELEIHRDADRAHREAAAARARAQLDESEQLFGSRLRAVPRTGTDPQPR
jgi:hypothetical protein